MTRASFRILPVHKRADARGALYFVQEGDPLPFNIRRMFAIADVPPGASRGGHAHHEQEQFLTMLSGSCSVTIDDGTNRTRIDLSSPTQALYVPPLHWLELEHFSSGAICVVLTSGHYDGTEYIREYREFLRTIGAAKFDPIASAE